jgi:hypothetical protein
MEVSWRSYGLFCVQWITGVLRFRVPLFESISHYLSLQYYFMKRTEFCIEFRNPNLSLQEKPYIFVHNMKKEYCKLHKATKEWNSHAVVYAQST